ncbi:MAG: hypothetical protein J6V65_00575 [Fibrobacterales bacterium]|nr:hypothetical protein [Fibrobacterales bacterium]
MRCGACGRERPDGGDSLRCPFCGALDDGGLTPEVSAGEAKDRRNLGRRPVNRLVAGGLALLIVSLVSLKLFWGILAGLAAFVGALEAIGYLVRTDEQFEAMHRDRRRPWF